MNETQDNPKAESKRETKPFRHPYPVENSKEVMFERMRTLPERIAKFKEKLDGDRKQDKG